MNQLLTLFELPVSLLDCVWYSSAESAALRPSRNFVDFLRYNFFVGGLFKTD
jgi:hypothetical protein